MSKMSDKELSTSRHVPSASALELGIKTFGCFSFVTFGTYDSTVNGKSI